ncbi:hypothetical protein L6V77_06130 [Myxococcota bacterium]|nr:hypothetical protein [Myxococcota bacterium]
MNRTPLLFCVAAVATFSTVACAPEIPVRDNGESAYVREVTPAVLGRRLRTRAEHDVYADLARSAGRSVVVDALMARPEFAAHWSEVLLDLVGVDRPFAAPGVETCYEAPLPDAEAAPGDLARHLQDNAGTDAPYDRPFNLANVLESAFAEDDLSVFFRAALYPLVALQPATAPSERHRNASRTFHEGFLDRSLECAGCHNSFEAVTGPGSHWTRHFPVQGRYERALWGTDKGPGPMNAATVDEIFRGRSAGGGPPPWGALTGCGAIADGTAPEDPAGNEVRFADLTGTAPTIRDVERVLHEGVRTTRASGVNRFVLEEDATRCETCSACGFRSPALAPMPNTAAARTARATFMTQLKTQCAGCHRTQAPIMPFATNTAAPTTAERDAVEASLRGHRTRSAAFPGLSLVEPGSSDRSALYRAVETGYMPRGAGLGEAQRAAFLTAATNWIALVPVQACLGCRAEACATLPQGVTASTSLAYLLAAQVVNTVYAQIFGERLTLPNHFPRNGAQRYVLQNLTEARFIAPGWSLRSLLRALVTGPLFNRQAPAEAGLASDGEHYELPRLLTPWTEADPRQPPLAYAGWSPPAAPVADPAYDPEANPHLHHNAVTDGVRRRPGRQILESTAAALCWPAPGRFLRGDGFRAPEVAEALGVRLDAARAGARDIGFQELLRWEQAVGACTNQRADGGRDYIDRLVDAVAAVSPAGPITARDVAGAILFRLTNDAAIAPEDEPALAALLGQGSLDAEVVGGPALEDGLRRLCGATLMSPQFLLRGLATRDAGPPPGLEVGCEDEPVVYADVCQNVAAELARVSFMRIDCSTRPLTARHLFGARGRIGTLCPGGGCGFLAYAGAEQTGQNDGQMLDPRAALPDVPPVCDPRCTDLQCCGLEATQYPPDEVPGAFLAALDGGTVKAAKGVTVWRARGQAFEDLTEGAVLSAGDLLRAVPGALLAVSSPHGDFVTPPEGFPQPGTPVEKVPGLPLEPPPYTPDGGPVERIPAPQVQPVSPAGDAFANEKLAAATTYDFLVVNPELGQLDVGDPVTETLTSSELDYEMRFGAGRYGHGGAPLPVRLGKPKVVKGK